MGDQPHTVVKASFGQYNDQYRDADVGNFNGNAQSDITYRWRDQDGNGNYTPGEVNLALNNNPDFISITARQQPQGQSGPPAAGDHRGDCELRA